MKEMTQQVADERGIKRLNYALYRVMFRMMRSDADFAVFVREQSIHFMNPTSQNFERDMANPVNGFVGVYNSKSDIADVVTALKGRFAEERGLIESHLYV